MQESTNIWKVRGITKEANRAGESLLCGISAVSSTWPRCAAENSAGDHEARNRLNLPVETTLPGEVTGESIGVGFIMFCRRSENAVKLSRRL